VHPVDNLVFGLLRELEELWTIGWRGLRFVGVVGDVVQVVHRSSMFKRLSERCVHNGMHTVWL
jgi:hypothetical protein